MPHENTFERIIQRALNSIRIKLIALAKLYDLVRLPFGLNLSDSFGELHGLTLLFGLKTGKFLTVCKECGDRRRCARSTRSSIWPLANWLSARHLLGTLRTALRLCIGR